MDLVVTSAFDGIEVVWEEGTMSRVRSLATCSSIQTDHPLEELVVEAAKLVPIRSLLGRCMAHLARVRFLEGGYAVPVDRIDVEIHWLVPDRETDEDAWVVFRSSWTPILGECLPLREWLEASREVRAVWRPKMLELLRDFLMECLRVMWAHEFAEALWDGTKAGDPHLQAGSER